MNIIICDDDKSIAELLIPYINREVSLRHPETEVFFFQDGRKLIEWSKDECHKIDILFIDVEMPSLDGIDTVNLLRNMRRECIIIYISNHNDRVFEALNYEIFNYLLKPINEEKFRKCLRGAIEKYKKNHYFHEIYCKGNHVLLKAEDICCIESYRRQVTYHTKLGEFITFDQISKLEKLLVPYGFLRTHKSFLINMEKVIKYKECTFYLIGGGTAQISNRQRAEILDKYYKYIKSKSIL